MTPLELVKLEPLMKRTTGNSDIKIGLIDGPVAVQHEDLEAERINKIRNGETVTCTRSESTACFHGTFVAGILSAKRDSAAPAICPGCTLLIRPIFSETPLETHPLPTATPDELAAAIADCVSAGANVINLSLALAHPSIKGEIALKSAIDQAMSRGVIVAAAAGNQGTLGTSAITRHPWVIPVAACDLSGHPMNGSNFGSTIGRRGLRAPGDRVTSLASEGRSHTVGGTSVAVPFVTGTIALLWSEFPSASAGQIKIAVTQSGSLRRASVVPPLLDAEAAYRNLSSANIRRWAA